MNFIALDFETANEKRCSPCSLGVCVVENSQIILEKYWLIQPKELRFNPMNIWIHGIRQGDVVDAPTFDSVWEELYPLLHGKLIVAHNASFDISVLRKTLDLYQLPYPTFDYCCTMLMSKQFFDYLPNAKLNTVNNHLGFNFNHHHAAADARACANILLAISKELRTTDIYQLSDLVGFSMGKVFPNNYTPCRCTYSSRSSSKQAHHMLATSENTYTCSTTFFKNKVVAFTGPLASMSRSEAIQLVEKCGGDYSPSVTLKTSIVVTGIKHPHTLTHDQMSTKLKRAMTLIDRGQSILFLDEETFLHHLKN